MIKKQLSHTNRSFEVTGEQIMLTEEGLLARDFFAFSVDDKATSNDFSYRVEAKVFDAPDEAYARTKTTDYDQDDAKTQAPATTGGAAAGFAEGDEWHNHLMRGLKYRFSLITPDANAAEADRVTLDFYISA